MVKRHFKAAGRGAESQLLSPKFHREMLQQHSLEGTCRTTGNTAAGRRRRRRRRRRRLGSHPSGSDPEQKHEQKMQEQWREQDETSPVCRDPVAGKEVMKHRWGEGGVCLETTDKAEPAWNGKQHLPGWSSEWPPMVWPP